MIYLISLCSLLALGVSGVTNLAESCNYYCSRPVTIDNPLIIGEDDVRQIEITENYIEVDFDYVITQNDNTYGLIFFFIGRSNTEWLPVMATMGSTANGFQINNPDAWTSIQPTDLSTMRYLNTDYHIAFYYNEGVRSDTTWTDVTTNTQIVKDMGVSRNWARFHKSQPLRVMDSILVADLRMTINNICIKTDRTGADLHVDLCATAAECPVDANTFNWDTLTADGTGKPEVTFTIDADESPQTDLSLNIEVRVPYIVRTSADDQLSAQFGTTYVLDFEDFDAHKNSITKPNTCSNRLEINYDGRDSTSSRFEILSNGFDAIGTTENMCYPPPGNGWEIVKDESDCNTIMYRGKWKWGELRECRNNINALTGAGEQQTYIPKNEGDPNYDPNYLTLAGTFYVNVISPFWYEDYAGQSTDFYRVYQLVSQPFVIQVSKSVYVIGSTGVNVMTMSIIAVYKEDQDTDYTLILLTETAEYMMLGTPNLIQPLIINGATLNILETAETGAGNDACLNNKAYLCSQLWKIEAIDATCSTDYDGITGTGGIDFGGIYQVKFDPICRNDNVATTYNENSYCNSWISNHPEFDVTNGEYKGVVLESNLVFMDKICEAKTFTVQLQADMYFYEEPDDTGVIEWTNIIGPTSDYLYQVGESTVYSEIVLDFPTDTEIIFGSTLVNVWLCTFPPFPEGETVPPPNQNGPTIPVDQATNGGCFSSERDGFVDGHSSDFFFHIFSSQAGIETEGFVLIDNGQTETNKIRFTFLCPHEIQRDTLYVHAQVEVLLQEFGGGAVRRMLLNTDAEKKTANKFAHFGKNIGITNNPIENKPKQPQIPPPQQPIQPIQQPPSMIEPFTISLNSSWVLIIGGLFAVILTLNIIFMCYMNCCKSTNGRARISFNKNRRSGYDSVKHIDSEEFDDSEANLINVN